LTFSSVLKNMPKKNYYEILGISINATQQAIQQAYRAKAMVSHPDRGGSHEAMLAINEAYEILINPEKRRHYDEARANENNHEAQQQARADTSQAQQQAAHYPREWADFETWLKRDFTDAAYYQNERGHLRVDNSQSGIVFMVIGFAAGIAVFVIVGMAAGRLIGGPIVWLFGGAGAGVGAWLHKQIGDSMRKPGQQSQKPNPASDSPDQRVIVSCPKCSQQLRAPAGVVRVRCPSCRFEFSTQQ
jgi:curved DNA-binding protein CbpA